jgi:hypothetical protein
MNGIELPYSVPKHDVKAFLFVQINLDVARGGKNIRAAILKTKIRKNRSCCDGSTILALFGFLFLIGWSRLLSIFVEVDTIFMCSAARSGVGQNYLL